MKRVLAYGVIGNTTDFGSVILGSSPSRPTKKKVPTELLGLFVPAKPVVQVVELSYICTTERIVIYS